MDALTKLQQTLIMIPARDQRELLVKGFLAEHEGNGYEPAAV
jgi:hypothetical protein